MIVGVLNSAEAETVADWIGQLKKPGFSWTSEDWFKSLEHAQVFGEKLGDPKAVILFQEVGGNVLEILALMTHPDFQRQGRMRQVFQGFLSHFKGLKAEVWLEVHVENNEARLLYSQLGFKQMGERPHYYGPGQNAVVMTKLLPS